MAQWVQLQNGHLVNIDHMHDIEIEETSGSYSIVIFRYSEVETETPFKYIVVKNNNKVTATRNLCWLVENIEKGKKVIYFNYEK